MSKSVLLMTCCLGGLLLLACSKPDATTNRDVTSPSTTTPAASPAATSSTTASTDDKVGVPECDAFITAYDNCVTSKVPESVRPQYKSAIATWRTQWKRLAENPQTKATLVAACNTQLETAKTQMKAFGCTF
jgi:hypothetical protein